MNGIEIRCPEPIAGERRRKEGLFSWPVEKGLSDLAPLQHAEREVFDCGESQGGADACGARTDHECVKSLGFVRHELTI